MNKNAVGLKVPLHENSVHNIHMQHVDVAVGCVAHLKAGNFTYAHHLPATAITTIVTTSASAMLCMFYSPVQRGLSSLWTAFPMLLCCHVGGQVGLQDAAAGPSTPSPSNSHSQEHSHSQFASRFPEQHHIRNSTPMGQSDMFAEPLTSQQQPASQQGQAHPVSPAPPDQPSPERVYTSEAAHRFPQQHGMRNAAPADEQSMFAEPLAHNAAHSGFPRSQAQAAQAPSPDSSSSGGHIPDGQEFASQHQVSNQGPHDERAYAQALASDQQEDQPESAQRESSGTAHDSAPEQAVSSSLATGQEHPHVQPLQFNQQKDEHLGMQASDAHRPSSSDEGTADRPRRQAQPLASGQHLQAADWEAASSGAAPDSDKLHSGPHHTLRTETSAHEGRHGSRSRYFEPLTSDRLQDRSHTTPADRDSSAGGEPGFPSQHSIHNAAPAVGSMYDEPLTSSSQQPTQSSEHVTGSPLSSEDGIGLPQSSEHGRRHSGDPSTLDDLTSAPELVPDREVLSIYQQQQPVHAQSGQDKFGSEQPHGSEGEGTGRPGGEDEDAQGQNSNAAQMVTSQQSQEHLQEHPQEQPHQSLTGSRLVSRLLHAVALRNECSAVVL